MLAQERAIHRLVQLRILLSPVPSKVHCSWARQSVAGLARAQPIPLKPGGFSYAPELSRRTRRTPISF